MSLFDTMSDQDVMKVLWAIHPRCAWHRDAEGLFVWDEPEVDMPTDEEITEVLERLAQAHILPRWKSYPVVDDQIDAIYKGFKFLRDHGTDIGPDADAWVDSIDAIKDEFPKPE